MTTSTTRGGASASARDQSPSLNLAPLASLVANCVQDAQQAPQPYVVFKDGKLFLNTQCVLEKLFESEEFKKDFVPGEKTGFLRDLLIPPYGTTARVGGRILQGTLSQTSKSVEKLHEAICAALDSALTPDAYSKLCLPSMEAMIAEIARTVDEKPPVLPASATLVPIVFATSERNSDERAKDIARVFSAIEAIDGKDWLETLLSGVRKKLEKDDWASEEIEDVVSTIRDQKNFPGSQIRRFLDFLDDEALSRVRLQVTMSLMDSMAGQSKSLGFQAYVARVIECFEKFSGVDGEALLIDVSSTYGQQNNSNLGEHLSKVMLYKALPVWPDWSVQLFEGRTEPTRGFKTLREVSYRFRVNGINPQTGESAFLSRLHRIHAKALEEPNADQFVKRDIGELIFLWLVVPTSLALPKPIDIETEAKELAARIKVNPTQALREIYNDLKSRSSVMDELAGELISLLQSKSRHIVEATTRRSGKFSVSLKRSIINWEAIDSLSSPTTDVLAKAERGEDSVEWFKHLSVYASDAASGGIASYLVEIELQERSLACTGPGNVVTLTKDLSAPVIPVRFIPYRREARGQYCPDIPAIDVLGTSQGVDVCYWVNTLHLRRVSESEREKSEQLRTASLCAFSLLVYITLLEVARRAKSSGIEPEMTIVRLQKSGKQKTSEDDARDGNTAVYGISQAIEKALSRELPVKLQGLTTESTGQDNSLRWKKRGALHALLGGQPLKFPMQGDIQRVALVSYVTRPCDTHPLFPDADGYLFVSRTYTAIKDGGSGTLRLRGMSSRLVDSRKEFKTPAPILEEIAQLREAGFEHIILLSHHFGNRHIGRAAERHSPHGTLEFLDEAATRFPDVNLYPLRRDVFPATRLRKRTNTESGFEVVNFSDHQQMYEKISQDVLRSLMPIYTFATLSVVGEESRPQSGFCTYFFDVEQRLSDIERNEQIRQNILGIGAAKGTRQSLVSVLRALHFMESEKPAAKDNLLPVLDPFDWATPKTTAGAGEIQIATRRGSRSVLLSVPAVLSHATKVLYKEGM